MKKVLDYIKLIRVKHWIKNLLVFLPVVFSKNLFNGDLFFKSVLAFIIFCFTSSVVYIINDISDIEKDKLHPDKKKRPLPSGRISIKSAWIVCAVLIAIIVGIMVFVSKTVNAMWLVFIPLLYLVLNVLYSKILKHIAIIDVFVIVIGFLLRTVYGAVLTGIEISNWLYLMIIYLSFYLGFGKRRNEIIQNGTSSRKSLEKYNKDFLDKNMYMCLALAITSYSLWCVDVNTIARIGNNYLIWSILLLMGILFSYSLDIENKSNGDPVEVVLNNKLLLSLVVLFVAYMYVVVYII